MVKFLDISQNHPIQRQQNISGVSNAQSLKSYVNSGCHRKRTGVGNFFVVREMYKQRH